MTQHRKLALACSILFVVTAAAAHDHDQHGSDMEVLGHVDFATSCAAPAQERFQSGVALLHSFEYDRATRRFAEVSASDPGCAMSYWGSAMSLYHQIWEDPSPEDLAAGWQFLVKAQAAPEQSAREKAWIETLATFYRPDKRTVEQRTAQYSEAMGRLHEAYPDDVEAAVFYALSLLAAEPPTDTDLTYARKAVGILQATMEKRPDHPGIAHYLIHACDSPALAQQGVAAARRYAELAPASPHALHMPSHIFARLGLWNDSITANLKAKDAAERSGASAEYRLHPMDFLNYAYLQTGQDDKAQAIVMDVLAGKKEGYGHGREKAYYYYQAQFPALFALETRNWKQAAGLRAQENAEPGYGGNTFWAQAIGAGHLKNAPAAQAAVLALEADEAAYRKAHADETVPPVNTHLNEAKAWLAYAQGDESTAFELLRAAIAYQDKVGKGEVDLPAREMYADMLLELGRHQEALEQYRLSLQTDPNRFNGIYGAGRAAQALGKNDEAAAYFRQLAENCPPASGPVRAELQTARDFLALAAR